MEKRQLESLGQYMDVKRGASLSGEFYSETGKYVRLTLGNFNYPGGGFKINTSKKDLYFTGSVKPEFIMKKGDVITPLTEQVIGLLGETATIPEDNKYIQSGDVALIIPDEKKLDKRFAYYLLPSKLIREQLSAAAQQTKIRHTSPDKIKSCKAIIPELATQKKIAHILDSINDKINLNKRMNEKLEVMAKRLYDYWFVQFDFPNEDGKPYKSSGGKMVYNEQLKRDIPEGWEVKPLKQLLISINTGLNPRQNFVLGNGSIKYVTVKNLTENGEIDFYKCDTVDKTAQIMINNRSKIDSGDILFASICPLGRCYLIDKKPEDWDINESVFSIKPNEKEITSQFLYFILRDSYYVRKMSKIATGSIFKGIRINELENLSIIVPNKNTILSFTDKIKSILIYKDKIFKQKLYLEHLRNKLLPLLMNGQVVVEQSK